MKVMECVKNDADDDDDAAELNTLSVDAKAQTKDYLVAYMEDHAPRSFRS